MVDISRNTFFPSADEETRIQATKLENEKKAGSIADTIAAIIKSELEKGTKPEVIARGIKTATQETKIAPLWNYVNGGGRIQQILVNGNGKDHSTNGNVLDHTSR